MTEEMKKDLEFVIRMCPKTKRIYVSGDFNNLITEPTILLVLGDSKKEDAGDYTYELCQWLRPKYDAEDRYPTIAIFVMDENNSKDLEDLYSKDELVYGDGRWYY